MNNKYYLLFLGLLSIGSFDVDGGMRIDIEGLVAHIEVTFNLNGAVFS